MTPEAAGFPGGDPLPPIGQATRVSCADGGEIWRMPEDAERVAMRLGDLGRRGIGGFVATGIDGDGRWIVRAGGAPTLATWLRDHDGPVPWRQAITMVSSLATAASSCEAASLFPGAFEPAELVVHGEAVEIRADPLVAAMVGGTVQDGTSAGGASARWLAPEQGAGRPADNASNRYLLGVVLYRLLAGEHPFGGRGLRLGLEDQAQRGAPPFAAEVAAELPPALQSYCLRLLDPDPDRRPRTAGTIANALRGFLVGRVPADEEKTQPQIRVPTTAAMAAVTPTGTATATAPTSRRRGRGVIAMVPVAIGVGVAIWAMASIGPRRSRDVEVKAGAPITSARALDDCAGCHPRQAAEWGRSVMAHAVDSPLFQSLEMLIEEQVGRDRDCPDGAGVLRAAGAGPCRDPRTGIAETGSGGELWCVNCHAPGHNLGGTLPAWNSLDPSSRQPLRDLLPANTMEGIGCAFCHQVVGPVHPGDAAAGRYEGNPSWISAETGARFASRPEDARGQFGIANSGYLLDPRVLLASPGADLVPGGAHRRVDPAARAYLASSEFCGACHDVRLFGTDAIGVERGEHFKRLRNAYSEWADWRDRELRAGRVAASCQDCHMSEYPGVCVPEPGSAGDRSCPEGTRFEARAPGSTAIHYFSGVDIPLAPRFDLAAVDDRTLDVAGLPLGARQRRDLLLSHTVELTLPTPLRRGDQLEIPVIVENTGAGHRVPAGFSQERELWVHLEVTDADGRIVYEVGDVGAGDEDLRDKVFLRVNTDGRDTDRQGRPLGLFGADVADGPDVPRWSPPPHLGGADFRGRGLINFQNGFLRCVTCIGVVDEAGACQPGPGQDRRRADRYVDGDYDLDTGECRSNLRGLDRFLETYFPVGALDASRGLIKGPDAIIDTRSLAPGEPVRYVYELDATGFTAPFTVEAELRFRAFPPFLIRAFADYEQIQDRLGRRPSGPLVSRAALERLDVVELAAARAVIR